MKNKNVKKEKKFDKKKSLMYTVFGVIGAFVVLFGALYLTEYFQRMVWHNGKVIIGENIITLPCSIEEFERTLNPEIVFDKDVEHIRNVKVGSVKFSIEVTDDMVTGIIVGANKDDETDNTGMNDRDIADDIVFPGNISVNSSLGDIKRTYSSAPLNVFKGNCPVNLPGGEVHTCDSYKSLKWKVEVYSVDSVITSISYYYIGK